MADELDRQAETVRTVSRTGSRFALFMLVTALVLGTILTTMSAIQLVQVRKFSKDLLVLRGRQVAVSFFMRYIREPQRGMKQIPAIVDEAAMGPGDFLQVLEPSGTLVASSDGAGKAQIATPAPQELRDACDTSFERLQQDLPWKDKGKLRVRRAMMKTILEPASAQQRTIDGHPVLDVLIALPMPPPPPDAPPKEQWKSKKGKGVFLDREGLVAPGGPCMVFRLGIDATAQRNTVLTHVGVLCLSLLTTLLVLGINILLYRALKQRERMAEEMQRARRIQSLGEMAATLAHELKNPVGAIRGYAQLMRESLDERQADPTPDVERVQRAVETIVRESTRLEELVARTLEFSRPGELKLEGCDLLEISEAACNVLAKKAADRDVSIITDGAPHTVRATVDRNRIEQVVANLLDNAIEASEPGSNVVIRTSTRSQKNLIEIIDKGRGIAPDRLEIIFQPFHTDRTDGTGLGLAVSRSIVEAHGGTIEVQSEGEGRGSVFRVALPAK